MKRKNKCFESYVAFVTLTIITIDNNYARDYKIFTVTQTN